LQQNSVPFYRFDIDVDAPPSVLVERLRSIVRDKPTFWESLRQMWPFANPAGPPFIGSVQSESLRIRRDIRYRNSFLPIIWGRVIQNGVGTRVSVTMFLHPLVTLFMIFWLGFVGRMAASVPSWSSMIPAVMFIFGIAMTLGGFIPEAIKAKRLISDTVTSSAPGGPPEATTN
jgi:hypothetical protein